MLVASKKYQSLTPSCLIIAALFCSLVVNFIVLAGYAHASSWNPGKIMDDVVFTNNSSMTVGQIQDFLNSKVPVCDTWGTSPSEFGGGTRAQWAAARGYSPPFTCLKDFSENNKSSAQIIYDTAQEFKINPQVLIVLLQKEQGLVTDTWPIPGSSQYRSATGYGCPDTAPCDSQYYGLTNQIRWSARMFRAIMNASPSWYTPYVLGNNYIRYSPTASCGGSTVNIQNRSTQALYNYTPYQPNDAALAAGWGTAPCGAYGNRNFYLYFTSWFGSTEAPSYSWSFAGQYAYTDSTKTTPVNLSNLMPGQKVYVGFQAKNTGNRTWSNTGSNPVRIGTSRDYNRSSAFYDTTWLGYGRPATLKESSVAPGETGTFEFWMTAPNVSSATTFSEFFTPLAEGVAWMEDWGMHYGLRVSPPTYTWNLVGQAAYTDDTKTVSTGLDRMQPGERKYVSLVIKNTGNVTWTNSGANPLHLGSTRPTDRTSAFYDTTWLGYNRPARMKEPTVAPGQNATLEFWIKAPLLGQAVDFREYFTPLVEGITWMQDIGLNYFIHVDAAQYNWSLVGQAAYTDDSKSMLTGLDNMQSNERKYVSLVIKNTGNVTWTNSGANPLHLGSTRPTDRTSAFYDTTWLGYNRPARMKEPTVAPGQNATLEFWIKAPSVNQTTIYREYFTPLVEGATWLPDIGLNYYIRVTKL